MEEGIKEENWESERKREREREWEEELSFFLGMLLHGRGKKPFIGFTLWTPITLKDE